MCNMSKYPVESSLLNRRHFLKLPMALATVGLVVGSPWGNVAHADTLSREQRDKMTPDEILAMMKRGNERFRNGEKLTRDFLAEQRALANGQAPAAMILSCIDSRAPAEVIVD